MEKKNYSSPKLQVEQFSTSHFAATGCNSQVIYEDYVYFPCTISCVVSSEDKIFAAKTGHGKDPETGLDWGTETCSHIINPNASQSGEYYFTEYQGIKYFIWHGPASGGGSLTTLRRILATVGITSDSYSWNEKWHAGPMSDCKEQMDQLLGFSF